MPTLLNNLCVGQYQACLLVFTRLGSDCRPGTGADDQVRTSCFASVDAQPQFDDGAEYGRRDTTGKRCFYVRDCNHFKQIDLTIQVITWDMELINLATGADLLVGKSATPWVGKSMGFGVPGADASCANGVAVEVYTKAAFGTGGFCVSNSAGAPSYIRHLFPFARLQMGQVTLDDSSDGILLNLTGFGLPNPNWGNGPNNDWPASVDLAASSPYAAVFTNTKPDSTCGFTSSSGQPPGAPLVFEEAVLWLDAYSDSEAALTVANLGTGGATLDAQKGSSAGVDAAHPKWLPSGATVGGTYIYFPGVAGNYLTTPHNAALDLNSDFTLVADFTMSDWTPAASMQFGGKENMWDFHAGPGNSIGLTFQDATAAQRTTTSSIPVPFTDGTRGQVAATKKIGSGTNDVKFWYRLTSSDPWVQLGTTQSSAGANLNTDGSKAVYVGANLAGTRPLDGIMHRFIAYPNAGAAGEPGTTGAVLDVNPSANVGSETVASFADTTGKTMTVTRSAAGRKLVIVFSTGKARWLFGTDDFLQVADDAVMDFSATESFTLLVVRREWGTTVINNSIVAAKIGVSGPYYALTIDTATQKLSASIYDGTTAAAALSASAPTDGTMLLHGLVRDVGNDLVRVYQGGTEVGNSPDTTTGTLVNSGPFYVGYNSGTAFWDGETIMAALWRRILTPTEIAAIATFYGV